jgi:hypothetical protein
VESNPGWHASGQIFENCNCTVICPGHTHFSQPCTHERCKGFWAIRIDEGAMGGVDLAGLRVVIAYDSPQTMIDGGWTEAIVIDSAATEAQRHALESILTGKAGGPWEVLSRFVDQRLPTRYEPIRMEGDETRKAVGVGGLMEGSVEGIRGRDRAQPVTLQNMFNQIHASEQVVARGSSHYRDGAMSFENEGTHGLWSSFSWKVEPASSGTAVKAR